VAVNRVAASAVQLSDLTWMVVVTGWRPNQTVAWTRSASIPAGGVSTPGELLVALSREVDKIGRGSS
jgi:hypothetical protein